MSHSNSNMAMVTQLLEWADILGQIGAKMEQDFEGHSEDVLVVSDNMRIIARFMQRKEQEALWDEAVADLRSEVDRLGLTELHMEEEVTLQGVPPAEWLYVINLDMRQLNTLRARLALLDNNREQL
jgi:hypothetical protein